MTTSTLAEVIADALAAPNVFALPPGAADELARNILRVAADRGHAGIEYYLPACHNLTRAERNARIRVEFNGQNLAVLMRRYDVSRATVYRVCRRNQLNAA